MENKQTTVEWLLENLNFEPYDEEEFKFNERIWEQAKAMEKEQIIDAFSSGEHQQGFENEAEQYYEETYGAQLPKE